MTAQATDYLQHSPDEARRFLALHAALSMEKPILATDAPTHEVVLERAKAYEAYLSRGE